MQLSQLVTIVVIALLSWRWVGRIATGGQGMSKGNRHLFNFFASVGALIQGAVIGLIIGFFASAVLVNLLTGAVTGLIIGVGGVLIARARH